MTSIDEVINRSREPGEFTERRQFTVARGRAIQKLREFALVDPHYYILELIQSAIANGATYIDVQCDRRTTALSYIGGTFPESALAQLFDFLFAAEDDIEHGPLRQLALGVNALMNFNPDEIVIESGDGTLVGTTRVVIREDDDIVEVGRPEKPLDGTFIRADGLSRRASNRRSQLKRVDGHPREYHAIESRCLVAPVPILVNHDPLFGYSSQRTPRSLGGFERTISFDEGDFYGAIGISRRHSGAVFRLLTHGVWIESTRHEFTASNGRSIENIGGVITYNRLRKTADHSAIVEDERYREMWLRLRPYINQLVTGQTRDEYEVRTLDGDRMENQDLIELLRTQDSILMVPVEAIGQERLRQITQQIADSLEIPVLCVPDERRRALQALGGSDIHFIIPDFDSERELEFYTQPQAGLPPRPWVMAPVELGTSSAIDIVKRLDLPDDYSPPTPSDDVPRTLSDGTPLALVQRAVWFLGHPPTPGQMPEAWYDEHLRTREDFATARLITPEDDRAVDSDTNIQVRTARRILWSGHHEAIAPGQIMVIDVSDLAPNRLWATPEASSEPVAKQIADTLVEIHLGAIASAANRGLRAALRTDVVPGTNAAQLIFASLVRRVVKRIRSDADGPYIAFSVVEPNLPTSVLDTPVLTNLEGEHLSLRDLESIMHRCQGLIYAVRTDIAADLQDLNRRHILVVNQVLERLLISLIGPTAYVRVDERDTIAEFEGLKCRDVAVGLRDYPDFPLLVEGRDPSTWTPDQSERYVDELLTQLISVITDEAPTAEAQERRRQAWRHLQWFALRNDPAQLDTDKANHVRKLPLFEVSDAYTCSTNQLRKVLDQQGHIEMLDGWAVGAGEFDYIEAASRKFSPFDDRPNPFLLTMDPFVLHLLGDLVQGCADYHLSPQEVEAMESPELSVQTLLERIVIDTDRAYGTIGIPRTPRDNPAIMVFGSDDKDVVLRRDLGEAYGVIGKLRLRQGVSHDDIASLLVDNAGDALTHLLARLPRLMADDPDDYERALDVLLDYAGGQTQIVARPDGTLEVVTRDPRARQILNTPIFSGPDGLPVSAMTVYRDFQDQAMSALSRGQSLDFQTTAIAPPILPPLERWIDTYLRLHNIHHPTTDLPNTTEPVPTPAGDGDDRTLCLLTTLEYWINTLHPLTDEDGTQYIDVALPPRNFFAGSIEAGFCAITKSPLMDNILLRINPDHWITHWLDREGEHSGRPIAWAILAAYAEINNALHRVTNDHELICQQRVIQALIDEQLTMRDAEKLNPRNGPG